jgi:hypothetical protein
LILNIRCPCCNSYIIINVKNNKVISVDINNKKLDKEEIEVFLKEHNIDFG